MLHVFLRKLYVYGVCGNAHAQKLCSILQAMHVLVVQDISVYFLIYMWENIASTLNYCKIGDVVQAAACIYYFFSVHRVYNLDIVT